MTSEINFISINEYFPVPGQDNDTQVFRDNFDTIKKSLSTAKDEITKLENTTAKLNQNNDFELNIIQNAVLQNNRTQKWFGGEVPLGTADDNTITIDFKNGEYQIYRFIDDVVLDFLNFPGDDRITPPVNSQIGVGKVTLELYGDGPYEDGNERTRTITFSLSGSGATNIKKNAAFPTTVTVTSDTDPIFIEVWRHTIETFYMNYLGKFE